MITANQRKILGVIWMPAEVAQEQGMIHKPPFQELVGILTGAAVSSAGAASYWLDLLHSMLGNVATIVAIIAGIYSIRASISSMNKTQGRKPKHEKTHRPHSTHHRSE
jgi:hypothetical protein